MLGQFTELGGKERREVADRGEHLAGAGEVIIALLISGRADRRAIPVIALHGAAHERRGKLRSSIGTAWRQNGRRHGQGLEQPLGDELADRARKAPLENELQQHVAGMRVDMLLSALVAALRLPSVQGGDEFRQRIAPVGPRLIILAQQQARRVGRKLPDGHAPDGPALLQLGYIFRHRIVERELPLLHCLGDQRRFEQLAQRGDVEQRVRRDRPPVRHVGETRIEEQCAAFDADRGRRPADGVARQDGADLASDEVHDLRRPVRSRFPGYPDRDQDQQQQGKQKPNHERRRRAVLWTMSPMSTPNRAASIRTVTTARFGRGWGAVVGDMAAVSLRRRWPRLQGGVAKPCTTHQARTARISSMLAKTSSGAIEQSATRSVYPQDTAPNAIPARRAAWASRISSPMAMASGGVICARLRTETNLARLPNSEAPQA